MSEGEVRLSRQDEIATVIFDRPAARNAMTWRMYEQLGEACARMRSEDGLRAAVFRGAGGKAFIAGTDIAQFETFRSGDDGISYEEKMEGILGGIEALPVPTLAVIEGFAIGGGLAIAAACDLRIATPGSRFGVPIARTLGNCLSIANYARLVSALGVSRAKRVLLLAENLGRGGAGGRLSHGDRTDGGTRSARWRIVRAAGAACAHHHAREQGGDPPAAARRSAGRGRSRARVLWQRRLSLRRPGLRE